MKTVHLIGGGDTGGARTHVLSLLGELNRAGEAPLLCLGDGPLYESALAQGLPCLALPRSFPAALRETRRYLKETGAALLHCHGSRANLTGALLRRGLGIPVITTVHSDHILDYLGRPWAAGTYGVLNAWALRRLDALVCVSDAMADTYRARGFGRVYAIYNGVDFSAPLASTPRAQWLSDHGVLAVPEDILVGTAARLDPVKDLATLIRGFALALEREPRLRLILAGTGPELDKLRAQAAALGAADRVHFPGWVEDVEGLYAALDIAALSSVSETFPYALTMAARYGLPVAATPVGGVPSLIENGVTGLLFPVGDARALGDSLVRLAGDAAGREALGRALHDRAQENFSLRAMGARQREIYKDILSTRS